MSKFALPQFQQLSLLNQALTHRSYVNEHPGVGNHNERLEFLGDAILNFLSGEFLYKQYPDKPEGELTVLRSRLVDAMQLSEFAIALGLGNQVKLGKGAELEGGRQNPRLLSSAFEALVGAYFLDQHSNIDSVRTYLKPFFAQVMPNLEKTQRGGFILIQPTSSSESGFTPVINLAAQENPSPASINYRDNINYKSHFQEWALANRRVNPSYVIVKESGPDHAKQFVAEVRIGEQAYGQGRGHKKQEAEKDAARSALIRLGLL